MKAIKLMLCMLLVVVVSLGMGTKNVYANELTATEENLEIEDTDLETEDIDLDTNIDAAEDSDIDEDLIEDESEEEEAVEESEEAVEEADTKETVTAEKEEKTEAKKSTKTETAKKTTAKKEEPKYTKSELRLLSALIYSEAGNQSYKGKLAVANVVLNRAGSKVFWHVSSVKEVIYDSKWGVQFSVIKKGSSGTSPLSRALDKYDSKKYTSDTERKNMEACIKAAKAALNGENNIGSYLYFNGYSNSLAKKYKNHVVIGDHIFYSR